ncbi:hypothetical protein DVH05_022355 [Phytophthora capsici]|nr:hypothetical protein DVH05_022355 [Phytophthora capsici]
MLIRKLRTLNNFFSSSRSSERIARLKQVQIFHRLPELATLVDVDVRVASTVKLFRRSIINYPAFQAFFQNASSSDAAVFNCISQSEWELAIQLEAIIYRVAELALVESQSATMLSSTMYVLLRVASTRMNSYKFLAYNLNGARNGDTNEKNFPRVELKLTEMTELAQRCIKRTLHQIRERIEKPSTAVAMSLLLDPRTRPSAKNFLRVPDCADAATDNILEDAKTLMRVEHRVFYRAIHADELQQNEGVATLPMSSPRCDSQNSSDTEAELLYGEEVSQPLEENNVEAAVNARADELLTSWLSLRIDWAEVVRNQYASKEESEKALAKVITRDRKKNVRVWNVEELCGKIDICRWFAEVGEVKFPSIAKLARVWLGRGISTAFQERVFSTGSFVMSKLRTRTDNERAQQQLLLRHNRQEIRRMEESKRQVP